LVDEYASVPRLGCPADAVDPAAAFQGFAQASNSVIAAAPPQISPALSSQKPAKFHFSCNDGNYATHSGIARMKCIRRPFGRLNSG
jgi:hypothetical protein